MNLSIEMKYGWRNYVCSECICLYILEKNKVEVIYIHFSSALRGSLLIKIHLYE
ncbi:hypothetical protein LINPERHAP1_LOCUS18567, partial [Linum perenne]